MTRVSIKLLNKQQLVGCAKARGETFMLRDGFNQNEIGEAIIVGVESPDQLVLDICDATKDNLLESELVYKIF